MMPRPAMIDAPVFFGAAVREIESADSAPALGAPVASLKLTTPEEWGYVAGSPDWIVGITTLIAVCCYQLAWSPRRGSPRDLRKEKTSLRSIGS
jgi:hypothetical protein